MAIEEPLDVSRPAPPLVPKRMPLRTLGKDGGRSQRSRQRLPEEDIGVEMDEWPVLYTISDKLPQSPPAGIDVAETIELGGHLVELQAQLVYQHLLARSVSDQLRLWEVLACKRKR